MIGNLSVQTIVGECFNTGGANPTFDNSNFYCQQFSRIPNGNITGVLTTQVNLAAWKTSGYDAQIDWGFDLVDLGLPDGAGALDFNLVVSKLENFERQARPGAAFLQNAGTIGGELSGGAYPEWKSAMSATYSVGPAKVTLRWRHIDAMTDFRNVPVFSPTAVNTPDYDLFDLTGTWRFDERVTMRAGVNNLGDKDPPLYTSYSNSNTDPSTYDVLGRRFFVGVTARF